MISHRLGSSVVQRSGYQFLARRDASTRSRDYGIVELNVVDELKKLYRSLKNSNDHIFRIRGYLDQNMKVIERERKILQQLETMWQSLLQYIDNHPNIHSAHLDQINVEKPIVIEDFKSSHVFLRRALHQGIDKWNRFRKHVLTRNLIKQEGLSLIVSNSTVLGTHPKANGFTSPNEAIHEMTPQLQEFWDHISIDDFPITPAPPIPSESESLGTTMAFSSHESMTPVIGKMMSSDILFYALGFSILIIFISYFYSLFSHERIEIGT